MMELQEVLGPGAVDPRVLPILNHLLHKIAIYRESLSQAEEVKQELKAIVERLTSPPQYPAVFIDYVGDAVPPQALVGFGGGRHVVGCGETEFFDSLHPGDEVLLPEAKNVIVAHLKRPVTTCGETATFERYTDDGRLVLSTQHGAEVLVEPALGLRELELGSGDKVLWNNHCLMAFDRVSRRPEEELGLEDTPDVTFDDIGGQDEAIRKMQDAFFAPLVNPDLSDKYSLKGLISCMEVGPPGNGKTMMAQALANWAASVSPTGNCLFSNQGPGDHRDPLYGNSERNLRQPFQAARKALDEVPERPVILFYDEIDSIGSQRGSSISTAIDDRVIATFLTELSGFKKREKLFVLAATNRRDLLDSALMRPGRLGDEVIVVQKPNIEGARAIFGVHFRAQVPYRHRSGSSDENRSLIIESAVSRIFSPNGDNELGRLKFRDDSERPVLSSDLISGASIANIANRAKQAACLREARTGEEGITMEDVLDAVAAECETLWGNLSRRNCHVYLDDLPQDLDVVSLTRNERKVGRVHRYFKVA